MSSILTRQQILVEEAAEILEAPVTVACLPTLEHLILVGDHEQLASIPLTLTASGVYH